MTEKQKEAARHRAQRESIVVCPLCDGKGTTVSPDARTRGKQGGIASYLKSLQPGGRPMGKRNQGRKPYPILSSPGPDTC